MDVCEKVPMDSGDGWRPGLPRVTIQWDRDEALRSWDLVLSIRFEGQEFRSIASFGPALRAYSKPEDFVEKVLEDWSHCGRMLNSQSPEGV